MKATNGAQTVVGEHPGAAKVAPRFTRAVKVERSRLEGRREQLRRKREAAQAEVASIDRAIEATEELLALLAPLTANGSEPDAADDTGSADAELSRPASQPDETDV